MLRAYVGPDGKPADYSKNNRSYTPLAHLQVVSEGVNEGDFLMLGTLPVAFLADLDITGGNSSSPAMAANGPPVSLAFDGNWESLSGDWLFNPQLNRSIQVDVRYKLWVMHHLDHADNLLKEMGVPAK